MQLHTQVEDLHIYFLLRDCHEAPCAVHGNTRCALWIYSLMLQFALILLHAGIAARGQSGQLASRDRSVLL